MKIAVLHGQSHKGSTWHVTRTLLDALAQPADTVTEFHTNEVSPCLGCFACIVKDEALCPHRSVAGPMIEALEAADVIIAASPNYCMGMSGQMKTFFDHMAYRWMSHRPHASMRQTIGVAISTTAGVGAAKAAKSIAQQMFWWGTAKAYRLSFAVAAMGWADVKPGKKAKIEGRVRRTAKQIRKSAANPKPQLKSKFIFHIMKAQQKNGTWNPVDRRHWEDNGWIPPGPV